MDFTNVSADDMSVFHLARSGYGTVEEIRGWDTPQFLDAMEFEGILADLREHHSKAK